jgi:hypothetical protein
MCRFFEIDFFSIQIKIKHMKKTVISFILGFIFLSPIFSQYQLEEGYIETVSDQNVNASFSYKNLRVYPLLAGDKFNQAHKDIGKYSTLKESLEKNKIVISETDSNNPIQNTNFNPNVAHRNNLNDAPDADGETQQIDIDQNIQYQNQRVINGGGGAQVNKLYVENISNDTVYIMAGEVVKGGKQDRVLAQDMILPPKSGKVDISVFCVEKNRWSYGNSNNFDQYFSVSSNSVRKTVIQDQDQSAVWEEVGKTVKKNKTETNTGTYTSIINSEKFNKELKAYSNFFLKAFNTVPNCIGFVGVSGDKIIGCDIFATPDLFSKQKETILKGYITESIINGKEVSIQYAEVQKYMQELLTNQLENQDKVINEKGGQYLHKNKKIHITTF